MNSMDEDNKVSINAATIEQLETLDGIGEKKAKEIVDYREKHGKFESLEDLKNVKGIGDKTFSKIEDRITLLSKRQLLNKKIKTKYETTKRVVAHKTLDGIKNIKTKISVLTLKAKETFYAAEVAVLNGVSEVKGKINAIIDKAKLKGKTIKEKVASNVGKVKTVTREKLDELKEKIASTKLAMGVKQAAANVKVAGLTLENKALSGINKIKEKAENVKYKIEDKYLLLKYKIKTKIERKKNVIARKTGMQIALLKDSIKKKVDNVKEAIKVDSVKLQETKEKINALKEERARLVNELFPSDKGSPAAAR